MKKTCIGCRAAYTVRHRMIDHPSIEVCMLGYKSEHRRQEFNARLWFMHPLEECPKPKTIKGLKVIIQARTIKRRSHGKE